jgi:hypothetical protein
VPATVVGGGAPFVVVVQATLPIRTLTATAQRTAVPRFMISLWFLSRVDEDAQKSGRLRACQIRDIRSCR